MHIVSFDLVYNTRYCSPKFNFSTPSLSRNTRIKRLPFPNDKSYILKRAKGKILAPGTRESKAFPEARLLDFLTVLNKIAFSIFYPAMRKGSI